MKKKLLVENASEEMDGFVFFFSFFFGSFFHFFFLSSFYSLWVTSSVLFPLFLIKKTSVCIEYKDLLLLLNSHYIQTEPSLIVMFLNKISNKLNWKRKKSSAYRHYQTWYFSIGSSYVVFFVYFIIWSMFDATQSEENPNFCWFSSFSSFWF